MLPREMNYYLQCSVNKYYIIKYNRLFKVVSYNNISSNGMTL